MDGLVAGVRLRSGVALFLGIDAGGSRTTAVLGDERRVLARAVGGTVKRLRVSADVAARNLGNVLHEMEVATGASLASVRSTCVGISGASVPIVANWIATALHQRVGGTVSVIGDVEIALDAAVGDGPGVLVMAGTGSNVAARLSSGAMATVGGWGPVLGDAGSGYQIGLEGLRAAFRALDRGEAAPLLEMVERRWEVRGVHDIVARAHAVPSPDFAALAPLVTECAAGGDAACESVLQRQGHLLGCDVVTALRRITGNGDGAGLAVASAGSILQHDTVVRAAMESTVRSAFPLVDVRSGVADPVLGALARARREAGVV